MTDGGRYLSRGRHRRRFGWQKLTRLKWYASHLFCLAACSFDISAKLSRYQYRRYQVIFIGTFIDAFGDFCWKISLVELFIQYNKLAIKFYILNFLTFKRVLSLTENKLFTFLKRIRKPHLFPICAAQVNNFIVCSSGFISAISWL